ncbi:MULTISPECIES: hypothetical protein [unclassified Cryobacterium]|uniref:hypothetical protein n=1 Tax=unclassified Cryobacterium TaxID=2649013 RepID=UPI00106CB266|nr:MULTISPECIES: hypothetical protein [unclassified Cryobacterium]TFC51947.1 hypothetical protein E3O68_15100 [Cryobacterium sp. TMB3-1-2]TFC68720.1 hypothetical protein E3T21_14485 [Cryobacterium sp. TMB3-15]TFC74693.1 hypothetical protein E3T22_14420 [Cryobacterium sp. TMB3-10]TFD46577.1 hypothetical protein E3T58_00575 [Cryobacterium sp. TMB3-12]
MSANSPWKAPAASSVGVPVRHHPAQTAAPKSAGEAGADALGVWALVVGMVAFLFGWFPVFGLVLGVTGAILSVLAKRRSNRRNFGRIGLIFSLWAVVFNIGMIIFMVMTLVQTASNLPG